MVYTGEAMDAGTRTHHYSHTVPHACRSVCRTVTSLRFCVSANTGCGVSETNTGVVSRGSTNARLLSLLLAVPRGGGGLGVRGAWKSYIWRSATKDFTS